MLQKHFVSQTPNIAPNWFKFAQNYRRKHPELSTRSKKSLYVGTVRLLRFLLVGADSQAEGRKHCLVGEWFSPLGLPVGWIP